MISRIAIWASVAAPTALAACSQPSGTEASPEGATTAAPTPSAMPNAPVTSPTPDIGEGRPDRVNDGYPDLTPLDTAPDVQSTEKGARAVLLPFARALELREFDQAWGMMDDNARQQWTKAKWNALFDGLERITVSIPGGRMEGAAGTSYYTSPASITATDASGRPVAIQGPIVLTRVNDIPGATPEQLSWRVHSADLAWTH